MSRRFQIAWRILPILLLGLAAAPAPARDIVFGFTPVLGQTDERTEFEPLAAYLSDAIGQKVVLYVAKNYGDLRTQMEAGNVDIGSFSPFAYVDAERGGKIRIIAQSVIDGSATYRGIIVARKDSGLKSLDDLRGKRFAFVDLKSASGYVYPRAMLVEKGINPDSFFKETIFSGDHEKVIADVLDGRVDAGATYDNALRIAKANGLPSENIVVIASTDPIPHDAIAVRVGLDQALGTRIRDTLVNMDRTEAGRQVIARSKKMLSGHIIAQDSAFDVVRRTAKIAGM
ncbi:MAG TPA: phosphate/phosphite/phosphonate ABC transporter substrate-binding protein [Verrucomicrobiae bacterium]|nr:phosphate/phosphite/phosphonate ABC transporter substrate-binding protein [Verrucomicrobiae bacterium]